MKVAGRTRWSALPSSLSELWAYREVLLAFFQRSLKVRYKYAALGAAWALIQPIAAGIIAAVLLSRVVKLSHGEGPYLPFAMAGFVQWTFFSSATSTAAESLLVNQALLRKVYFPRAVIPIGVIGAAGVDAGLALLVFAAVALVTEPAAIGWSWLLAPITIIPTALAATGVGLVLAALNVYFRDIRFLLPFILQLGLFAAPVVYSSASIPAPWRGLYVAANPVATGIETLRWVVLRHGVPVPAWVLAIGLLWAAAIVVVGLAVFRRLERGLADQV